MLRGDKRTGPGPEAGVGLKIEMGFAVSELSAPQTEKRVRKILTRRINLNPTGPGLSSGNGRSAKRRHLILSSFTAVSFAVRWRPAEISPVNFTKGAESARWESIRVLFGRV